MSSILTKRALLPSGDGYDRVVLLVTRLYSGGPLVIQICRSKK
ncbi:hypothetical protein Hanom_Chr04g00348031 [Helianthus anomalus]